MILLLFIYRDRAKITISRYKRRNTKGELLCVFFFSFFWRARRKVQLVKSDHTLILAIDRVRFHRNSDLKCNNSRKFYASYNVLRTQYALTH